jgi:succinyl-CoA synthetase beta subunit
MNLHEYQAKALFRAYGIPVPNFLVAGTPLEARTAAEKLSSRNFVVKAQVHAGGRGDVGGIKLVDTPREAEDYAKAMLGTRLVTSQTDASGQPINIILVEETCDVVRELYLDVVNDQTSRQVLVTVSTEGGMELDDVVQEMPRIVFKATVNPLVGILPEQCRELASGMKLSASQVVQFTALLTGLCKLFVEKDLLQVEINPLAITRKGELVCLDGKINIDDNALHRHKDLEALRDSSQDV